MPKKKKSNPIQDIPERSGKQMRLFDNLQRTAQQFMQGKGYVPLTSNELMKRLFLPEQHAELFEEVLNSLVDQGMVQLSGGKYTSQQPRNDVVIGIMRLHPRGFGFVQVDTLQDDIFIPKHSTLNAVDGDKVEVIVNTDAVSEKGPEGRVMAIVSRARSQLAGTIREIGRDGTYFAYAPLIGTSQRIIVETDSRTELKVGDRVVVKVTDWGDKEFPITSTLTKRIGHISDPSCDIPAAIEEYELRSAFPPSALKEAKTFGTKVPLSEIRNREDLRDITCFTIDPDTAKDFDDAISLTKDAKGHYHLGVHIADVSHYVAPGSSLDDEACIRCNSTYFPGFCLPMLPHELSSNLCSLKPNVNRLTCSVIMEFDPSGHMVKYRMARSVIRSAKRFTYKQAKAVLDGKIRSDHAPTLNLMVELCGLLKRKRYERGSIEFGLPELVVLVDDKGMPNGTDYVVYDITHQLVEEFMLKANEVVAWHLSKEGKNLTYRIHDEPSEENMKDFAMLAATFGFHLSPTPTPKEIQKLFDEAMETPYGEYLATSYIRRMRLAMYSADNIGHYGLSLTHYCHFTSPIRRYVDLVVHRILFHEDEEKITLDRISEKCSTQERISAKAENSVLTLKKLRLLDANYRINPYKEYEAVVTRVKNFGIYFEIVELMLEGYLHVSELENDYFNFDENAMSLVGSHTGFTYTAGTKITVMLKAVDFMTLESKWTLLPDTEAASDRKPVKKQKLKPQQANRSPRKPFAPKRSAKIKNRKAAKQKRRKKR